MDAQMEIVSGEGYAWLFESGYLTLEPLHPGSGADNLGISMKVMLY